jgi:hypothetical protein
MKRQEFGYFRLFWISLEEFGLQAAEFGRSVWDWLGWGAIDDFGPSIDDFYSSIDDSGTSIDDFPLSINGNALSIDDRHDPAKPG